MARYNDAAILVKRGISPGAIAKQWSLPVRTVGQHLYTAVGHGLVSRSEIVFVIDNEKASAVESLLESVVIRDRWDLQRALRPTLVKENDVDEALIYFDLRNAPLFDMFESICRLELYLHRYIKIRLARSLGAEIFWRELPLIVRQECVRMREEDENPQEDPYSYTTFIHLRTIFDKKWSDLSEELPDVLARNKQDFLSSLLRLNGIRNRVMHPVRKYVPTKDDYSFVSAFLRECKI